MPAVRDKSIGEIFVVVAHHFARSWRRNSTRAEIDGLGAVAIFVFVESIFVAVQKPP
jgi:hypothetical protein